MAGGRESGHRAAGFEGGMAGGRDGENRAARFEGEMAGGRDGGNRQPEASRGPAPRPAHAGIAAAAGRTPSRYPALSPSALTRKALGSVETPARWLVPAGRTPSRYPALSPSALTRKALGSVMALCAAMLLAACDTASSAVAPAGPQARRIATLWWITIGVLSAIYLVVLAVLLYAGARRRDPVDDPGQRPGVDRRLTRVVAGATIVTAVILFGFLILDVTTGRALETLAARPNPVQIRVIGHQWWWEVRYEGDDPTKEVTTANEIHIPVGRPVSITGESVDVIHSVWVPQLHGKRDLIPGYRTNLWIQADEPGIYRGQCAEFCGMQHAHMALLVVAEPQAKYEAWLAQQADTARAPASPLAQRGKAVFMNGPCVLCHSIRGTDAGSNNGPDLTHVGSRLTLGAGTLPNNIGGLMGWIIDPHASKPGNNMPGTALSSQDLQALVAYVGGLK